MEKWVKMEKRGNPKEPLETLSEVNLGWSNELLITERKQSKGEAGHREVGRTGQR